jgi:hypothetical protein
MKKIPVKSLAHLPGFFTGSNKTGKYIVTARKKPGSAFICCSDKLSQNKNLGLFCADKKPGQYDLNICYITPIQ